MAWGVVGPRLVKGLDQAGAEEVFPEPVDRIAGEVRVVRAGDPLCQCHPAVTARLPGRLGPIEGASLDGELRGRDLELWPGPIGIYLTRWCEERRELPELLAVPRGEGMVVALSAFELDPQEESRRGRRQGLRFLIGRHGEAASPVIPAGRV